MMAALRLRTCWILRAAEQSLEEVSAQKQIAEREVYSAKHRHEPTQGDLARIGLELTLCQIELARIRQYVENARLRADRAQHQLAAAATSRAEAEPGDSARLAEELVQLRGSIQTCEQNELAAGRAELAAMNERLAAAEAVAASWLMEERVDLERRERGAAAQQEAAWPTKRSAALQL